MCKRLITARHYACHTKTDKLFTECSKVLDDQSCEEIFVETLDFWPTRELCPDCIDEQQWAESVAAMDIKGKGKDKGNAAEEEDADSDRTITPKMFEAEESEQWKAANKEEWEEYEDLKETLEDMKRNLFRIDELDEPEEERGRTHDGKKDKRKSREAWWKM